jgi:hypothetical protein
MCYLMIMSVTDITQYQSQMNKQMNVECLWNITVCGNMNHDICNKKKKPLMQVT